MISYDPIIHAIQFNGVNIDVLRLDLLHSEISGNKWFKLKHNLESAIRGNLKTVITFGGAHSNHIAATAAAGKLSGLNTIGIIRGEKPQRYSPTLQAAIANGMQLKFVSREVYSEKNEEQLQEELQSEFGPHYIIPEGGNNANGRKGTAEISNYIPDAYTHVALAIGTGATFAGIRASLTAC